MQKPSKAEHWIADALDARRSEHLFREARTCAQVGGIYERDGQVIYNFCSNDYLDLARSSTGKQAISEWTDTYGQGATASRLVCGNLPYHDETETRLANFKAYPSALLFGSGYLANIGVITALVEKGDAVFADRLSHACILDGMRLSGARLGRFHHNNVDHLDRQLKRSTDARRKLVITESLFSMDGDLAPLEDLAEVCERHEAMLLVDEAHATGVLGPQGRGLISKLGLQDKVTISMGTMSKALGSYGGFVCCSPLMRDYLVNHARPFIYSTALPPTVLAPVISALDFLESNTEAPSLLMAKSNALRERLEHAGINTGESESPIIPLMTGDEAIALAIDARLQEQHILCAAIRPPTVPAGTSRLRLTLTLAHDDHAIDYVAERVITAFREAGCIA